MKGKVVIARLGLSITRMLKRRVARRKIVRREYGGLGSDCNWRFGYSDYIKGLYCLTYRPSERLRRLASKAMTLTVAMTKMGHCVDLLHCYILIQLL